MFRSLLLVLMCSLPLAPLVAAAEPSTCGVREDVARLVELVHQRLILADAVARYKWNQQMVIEDLPREEVIIEGLGRRAAAEGLPVPLAEAFFRAQIEASKAEQRVLFERWRDAGITRFRDAPDLITETRPQLDALTPKMIAVLARLLPHMEDGGCRQLFAQQIQARHRVPEWHYPKSLHIATAPLAEVAVID